VEEKAILAYMSERAKRADGVLFLGAGFSVEARNIEGEPVPTGNALKKRIWPLCFPDRDYNSQSSLADLYEIAKLRNRTSTY
jgi:hypothetical protein